MSESISADKLAREIMRQMKEYTEEVEQESIKEYVEELERRL